MTAMEYGPPIPDAGGRVVTSCPVRTASGPQLVGGYSAAIRNRVLLSSPPSMQAKQPRSRSMVCRISPPWRTRATSGGHIRVPDGVVGIQAYAVGEAVTKVCPYPPVGQAAGSL